MNRLRLLLHAFALLAAATCMRPAFAATAVNLPVEGGESLHPRIRNLTTSAGSEKLLSAVAANASSATRTITIPIDDGWSDVGLQCDFTRNAYTAVTVTATASYNHGATYGNVNSIESAGSGSWNLYTATWTKTTSSTTNELLNFAVGLADHMKFVIGMTGGGVSDLADCYVKVGSL